MTYCLSFFSALSLDSESITCDDDPFDGATLNHLRAELRLFLTLDIWGLGRTVNEDDDGIILIHGS